MPGEGETRAVDQRLLADRPGAERERRPRAHQLDAARDNRPTVAAAFAGPACPAPAPAAAHARGRAARRGNRPPPAATPPGAHAERRRGRRQMLRIGDQEEARVAAQRRPGLQRDLRADPGRIAEGQRDRPASLDDQRAAEELLEVAVPEAGDALREELLAHRLPRSAMNTTASASDGSTQK